MIAGDDGILAGQEAGDDGMRCPVCGFMNLSGADICDNCGADLFGSDVPQQAPAFKGQLLGEHLDELGAPPPITVTPDTALDVVIARMAEAEADCVLVLTDDRLVGIFTDRDAVVKAAGKRLASFHVRDFMTPDPVVLRHDDPHRRRDPQDGRWRLPPYPDRRGRAPHRCRHGARHLPPPRPDHRLTSSWRRGSRSSRRT